MKTEPSYDTEPKYGMRNALRLVLLFYAPDEWDQDRRDEWRRLTGSGEATTKVLCDHVRSALAIGVAGDAGEGERLYGLTAGYVLTERDVEDIQNLLADHNDELSEVEQWYLGRTSAFFEAGGQTLVDEMAAKDQRLADKCVAQAMEALERFRDQGGRK